MMKLVENSVLALGANSILLNIVPFGIVYVCFCRFFINTHSPVVPSSDKKNRNVPAFE